MAGEVPDPVEDVTLDEARSAAHLVDRWGNAGGFTAAKVSRAADTLAAMLADDVTLVLSFPAAVMATGLRGVLKDLVDEGCVDAIVTTCGTLDHDIARTLSVYRQGRFDLDDEQLLERGYHRLGNVLVPTEAYGPLIEDARAPILDELGEGARVSGVEFTRRLGERLDDQIDADTSLLAACHRQDVPVFVPGMTDGAVGSQLWSRYEQDRGFTLDLLADEHALNTLVHDANELGALMIGGGISKHHTIWWAQFADGLDRAVYITTAVEHDGSLSGARMREAISWSKLKATADHLTVEGEATVLVPLVVGAAVERA